MPVKKRRGVLALTGKYNLSGRDEIRTADELEQAVKRHPSIMLTYGHPTDGTPIPSVDQFVGNVFPYWDSKKEAVLADYSFFEEYWDRIPENIRNQIVNDEAVPISIGYKVDNVDEGGIQKGITFTHVALVPEGEEPIAENVGVNMRMESQRELSQERQLHPNYRIESAEIPEVPDEIEEKEEFITKKSFDESIEKLKASLLDALKPVAVVAEESETKAEPEELQTEPENEVAKDETMVKPEPTVRIPATEAKSSKVKTVNGMIVSQVERNYV